MQLTDEDTIWDQIHLKKKKQQKPCKILYRTDSTIVESCTLLKKIASYQRKIICRILAEKFRESLVTLVGKEVGHINKQVLWVFE